MIELSENNSKRNKNLPNIKTTNQNYGQCQNRNKRKKTQDADIVFFYIDYF